MLDLEASAGHDRVVRQMQHTGIERAAEEDPQQHAARRSPTRELGTGKAHRQDPPAGPSRDHHAGRVERMGHAVASEAERHDAGAGVVDAGEFGGEARIDAHDQPGGRGRGRRDHDLIGQCSRLVDPLAHQPPATIG